MRNINKVIIIIAVVIILTVILFTFLKFIPKIDEIIINLSENLMWFSFFIGIPVILILITRDDKNEK